MRSFAMAFVVSGIVTSPASASASSTWRIQHGIECQFNWTGTAMNGTSGLPTIINNSGGQVQNKSSYDIFLYCPVLSDSYQDVRATGTSLVVSGWANGLSGALVASACYTYYDGSGSGGACDTEASANGPAVEHLSPAHSVWGSAGSADSFYLQVGLRGSCQRV